MLKIQRSVEGGTVVFTLSGRIDGEKLKHLENIIKLEKELVVLDLKDVNLASRDAVAYLVGCEALGMSIKNCPPYIREWIAREKH